MQRPLVAVAPRSLSKGSFGSNPIKAINNRYSNKIKSIALAATSSSLVL